MLLITDGNCINYYYITASLWIHFSSFSLKIDLISSMSWLFFNIKHKCWRGSNSWYGLSPFKATMLLNLQAMVLCLLLFSFGLFFYWESISIFEFNFFIPGSNIYSPMCSSDIRLLPQCIVLHWKISRTFLAIALRTMKERTLPSWDITRML